MSPAESLILVLFGVYLLPLFISGYQKHKHGLAIALIQILMPLVFGLSELTALSWIVAMVWACISTLWTRTLPAPPMS